MSDKEKAEIILAMTSSKVAKTNHGANIEILPGLYVVATVEGRSEYIIKLSEIQELSNE